MLLLAPQQRLPAPPILPSDRYRERYTFLYCIVLYCIVLCVERNCTSNRTLEQTNCVTLLSNGNYQWGSDGVEGADGTVLQNAFFIIKINNV